MKTFSYFLFALILLLNFSCSTKSETDNLSPSVLNEIKDLFLARDNAVFSNDSSMFVNSQMNSQEIFWGNSKDYIGCSKMSTIIVKAVAAKPKLSRVLNADIVVFVREDYEFDKKYSHSWYRTYYLAKTEKGLKISDSNISAWDKGQKTKEESAITHVIKEYILAQKTFDSEKLLLQWAKKPYSMRIAGNHVTMSWDSLTTYWADWDKHKSEPDKYKIDKLEPKNINLQINGNFAVAIYDTEGKSHWEGVDWEGVEKGIVQYFEKINGEWKMISEFSNLNYSRK
jgi:hypothetical protein